MSISNGLVLKSRISRVCVCVFFFFLLGKEINVRVKADGRRSKLKMRNNRVKEASGIHLSLSLSLPRSYPISFFGFWTDSVHLRPHLTDLCGDVLFLILMLNDVSYHVTLPLSNYTSLQ